MKYQKNVHVLEQIDPLSGNVICVLDASTSFKQLVEEVFDTNDTVYVWTGGRDYVYITSPSYIKTSTILRHEDNRVRFRCEVDGITMWYAIETFSHDNH
jgi:hypothetical protein